PTGDNGGTGGTDQGDPVSISNGNLFQQRTDLAISSRGPAFVLTRTYNSLLAANDSPFGFGWTHRYNLALKDNQSSVTFINESGGVFSFALQGGSYRSPPGLNLALTKGASGFTLRNKFGLEWRFNSAGKPQSVTDRNGNAMQFAYDGSGKLTRLTD